VSQRWRHFGTGQGLKVRLRMAKHVPVGAVMGMHGAADLTGAADPIQRFGLHPLSRGHALIVTYYPHCICIIHSHQIRPAAKLQYITM
jgi:hypothetical protein